MLRCRLDAEAAAATRGVASPSAANDPRRPASLGEPCGTVALNYLVGTDNEPTNKTLYVDRPTQTDEDNQAHHTPVRQTHIHH